MFRHVLVLVLVLVLVVNFKLNGQSWGVERASRFFSKNFPSRGPAAKEVSDSFLILTCKNQKIKHMTFNTKKTIITIRLHI